MGSLVAGIGSVVLCVLGVILGPLAIILGVVARRREAGRGMALAGIVTGAVGLLFGLVSLAGLALFFLNDDGYSSGGHVSPVEITDDAEDEEDDNLFDDAADAGSDATGRYAGGTQETPCYSFEGASGWIANLSRENLDRCFMAYELWANYYFDDNDEPVVTQIGVGGIEAQLVVQPLSAAFMEEIAPGQDVTAMREYLIENLLTTDTHTVVAVEDTTLGGLPATRFDIESTRSVLYTTYAVHTPTVYTVGDGETTNLFLITLQNTYDAIWDSEEFEQRVLDTFTWK